MAECAYKNYQTQVGNNFSIKRMHLADRLIVREAHPPNGNLSIRMAKNTVPKIRLEVPTIQPLEAAKSMAPSSTGNTGRNDILNVPMPNSRTNH